MTENAHPMVSMVIPVYNCALYLERCLDSVKAQTYDAWEALCVENGSTDNSREILEAYAATDDRIKILRCVAKGPGAARNLGIAHASGEYLFCLDADDFIEPDLLNLSVAKAEDTYSDIVCWDVWYYDNDAHHRLYPPNGMLHFAAFDKIKPVFSWRDNPDQIFNSFQNWVWNKLFRLQFIRDHGIVFQEDVIRTEDFQFTGQALLLADRITTLPDRLTNYRVFRDDSTMATKDDTPLDFLTAYMSFKGWLKNMGLYGDVAKSFINWVVSGSFYNLHTFRSFEAFSLVFDRLKEGGFAELGAFDLAPEEYDNQGFVELLDLMMTGTREAYLFTRIGHLMVERESDNAWYNAALMDEQGTVRDLRSKLVEQERDLRFQMNELERGLRERLDEKEKALRFVNAELEETRRQLLATREEFDTVLGAAEQRLGSALLAAPRALQRRLLRRADLKHCGPVPKVSVVVPVYNMERFLPECLDSILGQTLRDIEVICVNDGSTDSSLDILLRYAEADERIRIISKENRGYGHTMNVGFAAAQGDYIGIVESDDFADPAMFETLYLFAHEHDLDVVKTNYYEHSAQGDVFQEPFVGFDYGRVFDPRVEQKAMNVLPIIWAALYRRSLIRENDIRFTESPGASYQDTSFVHQVWMAARRAAILKEGFLYYRVDNSASSVKSAAKVFAVCEEYERSEQFMNADPLRHAAFASRLNQLKFWTYRWNYNRISPDAHQAFAERMAHEFRAARDLGTLDRGYFSDQDWSILESVMEDTDSFVARHVESF